MFVKSGERDGVPIGPKVLVLDTNNLQWLSIFANLFKLKR